MLRVAPLITKCVLLLEHLAHVSVFVSSRPARCRFVSIEAEEKNKPNLHIMLPAYTCTQQQSEGDLALGRVGTDKTTDLCLDPLL